MFDYLGVLISVIMGLGLTHMLSGASRLVHRRHSVKIYWVQLVWAVTLTIYLLAMWWGMYWWRQLGGWSIEWFFFLAIYSIVLFLLASMLFPHEVAEGTDFEAWFMGNRKWFFGLFVLAMLLDIPETLMKGVDRLRAMPIQYVAFVPAMITVGIIGFVSANRRVHAGLAVFALAAFLGYLTLSTLEHIQVR